MGLVKLCMLSLKLKIITNDINLFSYRCFNIFFDFWIVKRLCHQYSLRLPYIEVWHLFVFSTRRISQERSFFSRHNFIVNKI